MDISTFRTEGLGDSTYLVRHDGLGVLVDPQRDIGRFTSAADEAGVELRFVLETHLHNDYISGGPEAARRTGAELVLPAGAVVPYPHTPGYHGEELSAGGLAIRPLHTPGHTPEHLSYLVLVEGEPVAVFSGGCLLVGSTGRSDLLGAEKAHGLALAQYHSVRRLAALPDPVGLYPTHGKGSFCTTSGTGKDTSTIGDEKRTNPMLAHTDADAFVRAALDGLLPYPRYYAHMGPLNHRGPQPMPALDVPELSVGELVEEAAGAAVVDLRPRAVAATGHVPGALTTELDDQFGVWVGWLVEFGTPLVLVAEDETDVTEALTQLARVGFDDVRGVFRDMRGWAEAGHPVAAYPLEPLPAAARLAAEGDAQVLDVRDPAEHAGLDADGVVHRYLPHLVEQGAPGTLSPDRPVLVGCATGYRAAMAASVLQRAGYDPVVLDGAGVPELAEAAGR